MGDFVAKWQRVRQIATSRRKIYPPRVDVYSDGESYWTDPPPVVSPRCRHWLKRIANGWRPGGTWAHEGYYTTAALLGVYIWEYLHLISPALNDWSPKEWTVADDGRPVLTLLGLINNARRKARLDRWPWRETAAPRAESTPLL